MESFGYILDFLYAVGDYDNQIMASVDQEVETVLDGIANNSTTAGSCIVCYDDMIGGIKCNKCNKFVCSNCTITAYNSSSNVIPTCPECRVVYPITAFFSLGAIGKSTLRRLARLRMTETAIGRELALISGTTVEARGIKIYTNLLKASLYIYTRDLSESMLITHHNKKIVKPRQTTIPQWGDLFNHALTGEIHTLADELDNHIFANVSTPDAIARFADFILLHESPVYNADELELLVQSAVSSANESEWVNTHFTTLVMGFLKKYPSNNIEITTASNVVMSNDDSSIAHRNGKNSVQACCINDCKGFLTRFVVDGVVNLVCDSCDRRVCLKCREPLISKHTCNPDTVKSVEEISKISKPCPVCSAPISRQEGCSHMFCPECKSCFDWETLKIQRTNTNPLFYDWIGSEIESGAAGLTPDILSRYLSGESVGEDGLNSPDRYMAIQIIYMSRGHSNLVPYIQSASHNETAVAAHLANCKAVLDKRFKIERILYINGSIDSDTWHRRVESLEMLNFATCLILSEIMSTTRQLIKATNTLYNEHPFGGGDASLLELKENCVKWIRSANSVQRVAMHIASSNGSGGGEYTKIFKYPDLIYASPGETLFEEMSKATEIL